MLNMYMFSSANPHYRHAKRKGIVMLPTLKPNPGQNKLHSCQNFITVTIKKTMIPYEEIVFFL